jgi:hypothetical protein
MAAARRRPSSWGLNGRVDLIYEPEKKVWEADGFFGTAHATLKRHAFW